MHVALIQKKLQLSSVCPQTRTHAQAGRQSAFKLLQLNWVWKSLLPPEANNYKPFQREWLSSLAVEELCQKQI